MTSKSKTPTKTPDKSKSSPQISSDDDHLDDGELSQKDLEKITGGRLSRGPREWNRR